MNLEFLFEKIRRKEVVLWIGAGVSKNAGMPSSDDLKEKIIVELLKRISTNQKDNYKGLPLKNVAETFLRACSSRFELNKILKECFGRKVGHSEFHELLAGLPFFTTIVTTNYDSLIEDAFKNKANIIRYSKDLSYIDNVNTTIVKIHGDLQSLDRIVITETDYSQNDRFSDLIWHHVKSLATHKHILFMGYGYEDPNVWHLFDKINEELGSEVRKKFLITPSIEEHDKNNLIRQGIDVFNMTAEEFILQLKQNIEVNIITDVRNKLTPVDTFIDFTNSRNINPEFSIIDDKIHIEKLTNSKGETDLKGTISFEGETADNFLKFSKGESHELEFRIPNSKLIEFSMSNFGLKHYLSKDDIGEIIFKNIPVAMEISIERVGANILLEDLKAEKYMFESKAIIIVDIGDYQLTLTLEKIETFVNAKFEFKFCEVVSEISQNQQLLEMILGATEKDPMIFLANGVQFHFNRYKAGDKKTDDYAKRLNELFKKLKVIQKYAKSKFRNIEINKIDNGVALKIDFIYGVIANGFYLETNKDKTIAFKRDTVENIINNSKNSTSAVKNIIVSTNEPIYKLFDKEFKFGFLTVEIVEPYIFENTKEGTYVRSKTGEFIYEFHADLKQFDFYKETDRKTDRKN